MDNVKWQAHLPAVDPDIDLHWTDVVVEVGVIDKPPQVIVASRLSNDELSLIKKRLFNELTRPFYKGV